MTISKEIEVDFAHRLINHKGLCRNFHGHRYKFEAFVEGGIVSVNGNSSEGMIIDFKDFKNALQEVIGDKYDHSIVITESDPFAKYFIDMASKGMKVNFVPYISTVENMGRDIFKQLQEYLYRYCIKLVKLKCWETPTSMAEITAEDI